jgi:hypothetical protein
LGPILKLLFLRVAGFGGSGRSATTCYYLGRVGGCGDG